MSGKLAEYRRGGRPKGRNRLWPLYGAGMESLGRDGRPIETPLPAYGPDELLVRHDACGLCFSDVKVIALGGEHPRLYRNIKEDPVVLGHEVSMTVVGVGERLSDRYKIGDRFIIQADIRVQGKTYAYGYMYQGGLSKYGVIDQRILNGEDGNYLVPVQPQTGYAESALTEPWACVIASYQIQYRTHLKSGGTTWIIGTSAARTGHTISRGFDERSAPARLLLTDVPSDFAQWLRSRARELGTEVTEVVDIGHPPLDRVDDIVVLGPDPDIVEAVSPRLPAEGILAILADAPLPRPIDVDIGRVHYDHWLYVGSRGLDVAAAYADVPVRSTLKRGGKTWFVGAGGPMGRMHVQRALRLTEGPATMVCTDVSDSRLEELRATFAGEAQANGIEMICLNPSHKAEYEASMARFKRQGFDDIVVLAPVPAVISAAATCLATGSAMNIFAGVARGTMAKLDLSAAYLSGVRVFGHSASTIADLRLMLQRAESGELSPNRSVAAVGSLGAARDGLQALKDTTFPGKVVIFPHIKEMPLTPLTDLQKTLPSVYARLKNGREWTAEAEEEFLRIMLES